MRFGLLLVTMVFLQSVFGQNIVPNPSFEDWDGTMPSTPETLSPIDLWYNVAGTPDHHHVDNNGTNLTSLDVNCDPYEGYIYCGIPFEGDAVLGTYKANGMFGGREWGGVQLMESMVEGNCYEVSYYIACKKINPDQYLVTNNWGIFFSEDPFPNFSINVVNYDNYSEHFVTSQELTVEADWQHNFFNYQAGGNYDYIFLGYVGNQSDADEIIYNDNNQLGPYAWFDSISIIDVTPTLSVSDDVILCPGETTTVTIESNYDIEWQIGTETGNEKTFEVTPDDDIEIIVQTLDTTACTKFDTIAITINDVPTIEIEELVCIDNEVFTIDQLNISGTFSGTGIIDPIQGTFDPSTAGIGEHMVEFDANDDCLMDYFVLLTVSDNPTVDFTLTGNGGCVPLDVTFSTTSSGQNTWTLGDGTTEILVDNFTHTYTEPGNYTVSLYANYSDYCNISTIQSNAVVADSATNASFEYTPFPASNTDDFVTFINNSSNNAVSFLWDFGNGETSTLKNPEIPFELPGNYEVQLISSTAAGCIDSTTVLVRINSNVKYYIPNVFTPNGDGINDKLDMHLEGLIAGFTFEIYDRWGNKVFTTDNFQDSWDGKFNGRQVMSGVYSYKLSYVLLTNEFSNSKEQLAFGTITVMR